MRMDESGPHSGTAYYYDPDVSGSMIGRNNPMIQGERSPLTYWLAKPCWKNTKQQINPANKDNHFEGQYRPVEGRAISTSRPHLEIAAHEIA
jgi:hypothetical protein